MFFFPFVVLFLVQSTWGYMEDNFFPVDIPDDYVYTDELPVYQKAMSVPVQRRNNNANFMRFGRSDKTYDTEYDDYNEDFARPTRSGKIDKSDHYIRFGRSKQDFLRFGRDQRDRSLHLRFGRSTPTETDKKRTKRETTTYPDEYKRTGSNFLRFGRGNSNYMRFGRNLYSIENAHVQVNDILEKLKQIHDSPILNLLNDLALSLKQDKKCNS